MQMSKYKPALETLHPVVPRLPRDWHSCSQTVSYETPNMDGKESRCGCRARSSSALAIFFLLCSPYFSLPLSIGLLLHFFCLTHPFIAASALESER